MSHDWVNCSDSGCYECTEFSNKQHQESLSRIKEYGPELVSFLNSSIGEDAMDVLFSENNIKATQLESPWYMDQMGPQKFDKIYSGADKLATTVDKL